MLYRTYRYSQWDGTQRIFDIDADALMDQLSDELLKQGDMMKALRELFRNGAMNQSGQQLTSLRDLIEQLKNRRREQLQQYNMDSVVDDLRERLEDIIRTEREGIDRRLEEARQQVSEAPSDEREQQESFYQLLEQRAQRNRERLDDLPEGVGGQIQQLMEYDFMDPDAQQKVQELEKQMTEAKQENERLSAELTPAKSSLEKAEAELTAAKEESAQANVEVADLQKQLEAATAASASVNTQLEEVRKEVADAKKALAEAKTAHEKALTDAQAAAAEAQAEVDALKTQVADLTKKLEEAKKEKEQAPSEPPQP